MIVAEVAIRKHRDDNEDGIVWRRAIRVLLFLRMYAFLPFVLGTTVILVLYGGGSAFSICMNAVALLFVSEIDDRE